MDGTAYQPFVYRVLIPFLVKVAVQIFPLPPTVYASFLIYCSFLGFVLTMRSFSSLYWPSSRVIDFIGLISPVILIPLMLYNRHIYDLSTLFLFSLGLRLMAEVR
jgi:hypothetical protein